MHDPADSHPDIHWPSGFSPAEAHGFHHVQAVVPGPPERVFRVLTDAADWTSWVPGCEEVSTRTFTQTFEVLWCGHRFEVYVGENVPPRRLGWMCLGTSVRLYQGYLLTEVGEDTEIVVESAVRAFLPKAFDTLSPTWVERLDELWQAQLARLSDGPPPGV
ncbi:SRPBCC family protein [Streptomyces sp. NPDC047841]|uniref:SRPBCC family protein n=1 Tax=Streptomyces sp. NPDC047841 TaxID=3154708 RepID=UPI00345697C8